MELRIGEVNLKSCNVEIVVPMAEDNLVEQDLYRDG